MAIASSSYLLQLPLTTSSPSLPSSIPLLLQQCTNINQFKQIHSHAIKLGLHRHPETISNLLLCPVLAAHHPDYTVLLFLSVENPNQYLYNTVFRSLSLSSVPAYSLPLYVSMITNSIPPNNFTFPFLLKSCSKLPSHREGEQLHGQILKLGLLCCDAFVRSSLVNMYARLGFMETAHQVFDESPVKDFVSRTALITGYSVVARLDDARRLFDESPEMDVVAWSAMIAGYNQRERFTEALKLYNEMRKLNSLEPNESIMVSVLCACANSGEIQLGKWVHSWIDDHGFGSNARLINSLVDMYAKCGDLNTARRLFDSNWRKTLVSWNIMITGYSRGGAYKETLELFRQMQVANVEPNEVTLLGVLPACANLGALDLGRWIHTYIDKNMADSENDALFTALITMYGKCGSIDDARRVFDEMGNIRSSASWNSMISNLAMHGHAKGVLELFERMKDERIHPDGITFIGVLSACSHSGMVDEGRRYFESMTRNFRLSPLIQHYGCMVDLYGRAGLFDEAEDLINRMDMKPDGAIWGSLLSACCVHGNVELAETAARQLFELEPENPSVYVLLSNIYARVGRWEDVARVRTDLKNRGMKKTPGCSLIEVDSVVHEFLVCDRRHPRSDAIYEMVDEIDRRLEIAGHVVDTSEVVFDMDQEGKEGALRYHSERLAIAFGLISTEPRSTIRIVKNLRVCGNCHSATKLISKIFNREIIARDRNRFHHFKDGTCSCMDYW